MSRYGYQFPTYAEPGVVELFLKATFASGVATLVQGAGVKSITRTGAGAYTVVFGSDADHFVGPGNGINKYQMLLAAQAVFIKADGTEPTSPIMSVKADSVSAATGSVDLVFFTDGGVATNPGDNDTLLARFSLLSVENSPGF